VARGVAEALHAVGYVGNESFSTATKPGSARGLRRFERDLRQNEGHTLVTKELCDWLTKRF
jgi:hypothetical protein